MNNMSKDFKLTLAETNLLSKLKKLVEVERKTLTQILEHLQQVFDTRLFAKLGYSSLHKYLIHELGYSESAAFRRVQALKLVREVPESKEMIASGELSLTNIACVQTMLKGKDTKTKKKAIQQVKKKTSSEAQDLLFAMVPEKEAKPRDMKKKVSSTHTRLSVTLSATVVKKMERVKAATKKYDNEELIHYLLDLALEEKEKEKANNKKTRKSKGSANPRVITAKVKREVTQRAQGKCEHPGCDEIHYLEFDHAAPVAHGGKNNFENIRLVCRAHNQFYAIEKLGISKMKKYLK